MVKQLILERLEQLIGKNPNLKILDLGSGQSKNFLPLLEKYPDLTYVGIEPNKSEADKARKFVSSFRYAQIINGLAYEKPKNYGDFDVCISLSVLEHIKDLEKFLINSVDCTRYGGKIIHFFDLGHSLAPHSVKEKLHVFLGNQFPKILPEKKFVSYVDEKKVTDILGGHGVKIDKVTYHQMPDHKRFIKAFSATDDMRKSLVRELCEWEFKASGFLRTMDRKKREKLFPSICIWGTKA